MTGAKAAAYCMALSLPTVAPMGGSQSITSVCPWARFMFFRVMPWIVTRVMAAVPVFSIVSFSGALWPVSTFSWTVALLEAVSTVLDRSSTLYANGCTVNRIGSSPPNQLRRLYLLAVEISAR